MSDEEKIAFVQSLIDDVPVDTGEITTYLTVAAQRIIGLGVSVWRSAGCFADTI